MRKYVNIYSIFEYLLTIVLVLDCRSIWLNLQGTRKWFSNTLLLLLIISTLVCVLSKAKFCRKNINYAAMGIFFSILYMFVFLILCYNYTAFIKMIIAVCCLIIYFCICANDEQKIELFIKYSNVVYIIASFSLMMWIIGPVMKVISPSAIVYYDWPGIDTPIRSYYGIYFDTQGYLSMTNIFSAIRNTAIFNEAPMCSFQFSIALLIELFLKKEQNKIKLFILSASVISTISTTGYVLLILAFSAKYVLSRPKKKGVQYIKVLIIPLSLIIMVYVASIFIISKLQTLSGNIRIDDFVAGFNAWLRNPFWGAGFGNQKFIQKYMANWRGRNRGYSNSLMALFAQMGIFGAFPFVFPIFIKLRACFRRKNWNQFFFIGLTVYLIIFTIVTYNFITLAFIIWCYASLKCREI